jgi:hypothetical protein
MAQTMDYNQTFLIANPLPDSDAFNDQISAATASAQETYDAIGAALASSAGVGITMEAYVPGEGLSYVSAGAGALASDSDLSFDDPAFYGEIPAIPDLSITVGPMPEPSFAPPPFEIPDPPDIDWPELSTDPPQIATPQIPTAPDVALPDPPSIEDVVVPAPPEVSVPEFDGTAPNIDLTPPQTNFLWSESAYTTALMTAIKERLEADVATGGQGLSAAIEQQIYDRNVADRIDDEEQAYIAALNAACARGFMLPPGEVVGQTLRLSDSINKQREQLNNQLVVDQTQLAQDNTHFAMQTAIKVETVLLQHHSKVQQRSYEAARFALSAVIENYKAQVEAYRARAQAFGVAAKVYEAKIRAEIVKAEIYRARVEGVRVGIEANELRVDVYKAQLRGIAALVEMYKAEMEAGRVIAEVERTRMQSYMAQVEAYKARVEAIQAQYDGYVAQVRGEVVRADMVKADAKALKAHAEAYRTQAEVELEEARAVVESIRARLQIYAAQIERYSQQVRYNIGQSRYRELNDQETANLRVVQARLDKASNDLSAANYNAQTVENDGLNRATAIAESAEQQARVTVQEASAMGVRAAMEAQTAVQVATNAANTTSVSKNRRTSASVNTVLTDNKNSTSSHVSSITVGFYTHIRRTSG